MVLSGFVSAAALAVLALLGRDPSTLAVMLVLDMLLLNALARSEFIEPDRTTFRRPDLHYEIRELKWIAPAVLLGATAGSVASVLWMPGVAEILRTLFY
jgi:hypothetical protein